jgi:asparagine synthase (glutamine-hydrolysing)
MCAIIGVVYKSGAPSKAILQKMLSMLLHRGPDESFCWSEQNVIFGINRLSIINIENGAQPVFGQDQSVVAVMNGEIFNYIELGQELRAEGYWVPEGSDAAVIPAAFQKWGHRFVEHLNGDFAIALWLKHENELVLYRDRIGVRPLFYTITSFGDVLFSSEAKALLAHPDVSRSLNLDVLGQIASYWTAVDGHSIFSGLCQVPSAHYCRFHHGKLIERCRYWDVPFVDGGFGDSPISHYEDGLFEHLTRSTKLRLRSDVEVGTYTSGGIDSSAINYLVSRTIGQHQAHTFSVSFDDPMYDESSYQKLVSNYLDLRHHEVHCTYSDIYSLFPLALWHAEQPLFRTAPIPMMKLSGEVRQSGIKVVLTGEGADEMAWGYDIFGETRLRKFWSRQPDSRTRPQLFKRLYGYLPQFQNPRMFDLSVDFFRQDFLRTDDPLYSHHTRMANSRANHAYFSSRVREALQLRDPIESLRAHLPEDFMRRSLYERCQYIEIKTLLTGYLLSSQGDRMQSANGIEGRFPFLDHNLIEYLASVPPFLKLRGVEGKHILRRIFSNKLPRQIIHRNKFAYRAPGARAFVADPDHYVRDLLSIEKIKAFDYFDADRVESLKQRVLAVARQNNTRDDMAFIQILSTQMLHAYFIENNPINGIPS